MATTEFVVPRSMPRTGAGTAVGDTVPTPAWRRKPDDHLLECDHVEDLTGTVPLSGHLQFMPSKAVVPAPLVLPARTRTRPEGASATTHEQRDIEVLGLRLRYVDIRPRDAESDVPVLLIHGHSSRLEEYDELVPHLSGRRRVLVPDLPGSGYSDKPDRPYSLRLFEDSLLGFLDSVGVDRCHLAGGSLGGNLVLRLGHREPERFAHLAAWAPAGAWERMQGWALYARIMRHLRFMFWPNLWIQSRFWYSKSWAGRKAALENAWRYYREVYGPGFHRMYWEIGEDQVTSSLFDHVHEIDHPTYLAYGEHDTALDMNLGVERLAKLMKKARLRVFANARHSLANEIPEMLGKDVDEFLAAADPAQ
jgi:pimeloyl-ACP methyl ester carboxylesterase